MGLFKKADMQRRQCEARAETATMWPQAWSTSSHQELEEVGRTIPWSLQREHRPADTFMSDFWPLGLSSRVLARGLPHGDARCIEGEEEHFPTAAGPDSPGKASFG